MIKKIRLMLEYNTYCIWLYDENDEIIDNDNPPEWDDDTFYIDNGKEFRYVGCPDQRTREKLKSLIANAVSILMDKNNGKYSIQNDIHDDF